MMFAFSATAYAATFTDLEDKSVTVQDAVAKTVALGIIDGYTDGTFGADKNITRAEFAKIAVTAAGSADTATMLEKTASSFKDVKAGAWYTGWVNAAEALGLVQGVGNGNYNPNATITNQEVVTVLMRMLGYNDNLPGNWPVNYVTQANKEEILDNVAIVAAAPATRGDVVVMLDDALDAEMVTYDKDTNEFVMKQNKINDSAYLTLLDDSFKGKFAKVNPTDKDEDVLAKSFAAVTQVKDAEKQTLTWMGMTIDDKTEVSYNGGSLFNLEGHTGKIYYVTENDKEYVRFIEVESYTKKVSDKPKHKEGASKVEVGKTSYNAADGLGTLDLPEKNSTYVLWFNDDDQVYDAKSDAEFEENAYYVKSVKGSAFKLVGEGGTVSETLSDEDVLIWNGDEFMAPSELKVGDAIREVGTKDADDKYKAVEDLYILVDDATGKVTKTNSEETKVTIDGTEYTVTDKTSYVDEDFDKTDKKVGDTRGHEVSYLLNKDNTVAAMILGDDITGTSLYGIIVGGSQSNKGGWGVDDVENVELFTAEGTTVTFALDEDEKAEWEDAIKPENGAQLIEYKLNKDGEIDYAKLVYDEEKENTLGTGEIKIKNNAYLVGEGGTFSLASDVVIFEVGEDDGDVDVALVTRASLLAGDDFDPEGSDEALDVTGEVLEAYSVYDLNSNDAIKVLAYTTGESSDLYGVADGKVYLNEDDDKVVMLVGDDTEYEVKFAEGCDESNLDNDFLVYTKAGGKITIQKVIPNKADFMDETTYAVTGVTDGLISFGSFDAEGEATTIDSYMTDDETKVYVMDSKTGKFVAADITDVDKYDRVVILTENGFDAKEDYVKVILVDNYNDVDANGNYEEE